MTAASGTHATSGAYVVHPWETRLGIVWRLADHLGVLVALSLAWILALALIVPLPAVTAAILRVALVRARGRSPSVLPELAAGLRESWRRATALGALSVLVTLVLGADLWFLGTETGDLAMAIRSALIILAASWFLVSIHIWALVGGTGMPSGRILRVAVGLTFIELRWTLATAAGIAGALALLSVVPPALILIGPGLIATTWASLAWRAMQGHLDPGHLDS